MLGLLIVTRKTRECFPPTGGFRAIHPESERKLMVPSWKRGQPVVIRVGLLFLLLSAGHAQECFSGTEIDAPTSRAVEAAAQQYFNMSAQGDVAGLKANALP